MGSYTTEDDMTSDNRSYLILLSSSLNRALVRVMERRASIISAGRGRAFGRSPKTPPDFFCLGFLQRITTVRPFCHLKIISILKIKLVHRILKNASFAIASKRGSKRLIFVYFIDTF